MDRKCDIIHVSVFKLLYTGTIKGKKCENFVSQEQTTLKYNDKSFQGF